MTEKSGKSEALANLRNLLNPDTSSPAPSAEPAEPQQDPSPSEVQEDQAAKAEKRKQALQALAAALKPEGAQKPTSEAAPAEQPETVEKFPDPQGMKSGYIMGMVVAHLMTQDLACLDAIEVMLGNKHSSHQKSKPGFMERLGLIRKRVNYQIHFKKNKENKLTMQIGSSVFPVTGQLHESIESLFDDLITGTITPSDELRKLIKFG